MAKIHAWSEQSSRPACNRTRFRKRFKQSQAIIRSIISLGKGLGVIITAEGVETEAELSCLRAEGRDEGQGFLFSKARPNAEIISLLAAQCGFDALEDAALVA